MKRIVAMMAAIASLAPLGASAQEGPDAPVAIAFVRPHAPAALRPEERALFDSVNAERVRRGLAPLVRDENLDRLALAKAQHMATRGYFGHTDPDGVTFEERFRAARLQFTCAAENLAFDEDEPHAHAAFMHSPEHRANVLDPEERRLGVAVVTVGDGETFYVEEFSG
jgi:uncharacterized protein YkwD